MEKINEDLIMELFEENYDDLERYGLFFTIILSNSEFSALFPSSSAPCVSMLLI